MWLRASLLFACVAGSARAGEAPPPAIRYNAPSTPAVRSDFEHRIEALVAEVATAERRTAPHADPRLERAATALALVDSHGAPSNDLVEAAMRLYGLVEPPPHLILASAGRGQEQSLLDELRLQLPRALASGRYNRVAAAAVERGDSAIVVLALQESAIELEPIPRALMSGGPTPLRGRLLGSFAHPTAIVTDPSGKTESLALTGDAKKFQGTFRCGPARGHYQVELTGEDRFGSTVLANFPIYCGLSAPMALAAAPVPVEAPVTDATSAEAALLRLVNQDRANAGLRPLVADARLAEVARGHCRDMLAHGFVGHVSPTTGDAAARVARAKIRAALILENVARAYSPGEVERGLMDSPGHRRNILSPDATKIGIGALLSETLGGARELLVTQVFIQEEAPFHPASAEDLRARIAEFRRKLDLSPFLRDAELDHIADNVARDLASGRATPDSVRGPLDRAMSGLGARYRSVRSLFAVVTEIAQVTESLKESLSVRGPIPAIGIGLSAGAVSNGGHEEGRLAHHVVILIAVPR